MIESGIFEELLPPKPKIEFIQQTGELSIEFDQDMKVLPRIDMINSGYIELNGKKYPVFDIEVMASSLSSTANLGFEWQTITMTERKTEF